MRDLLFHPVRASLLLSVLRGCGRRERVAQPDSCTCEWRSMSGDEQSEADEQGRSPGAHTVRVSGSVTVDRCVLPTAAEQLTTRHTMCGPCARKWIEKQAVQPLSIGPFSFASAFASLPSCLPCATCEGSSRLEIRCDHLSPMPCGPSRPGATIRPESARGPHSFACTGNDARVGGQGGEVKGAGRQAAVSGTSRVLPQS